MAGLRSVDMSPKSQNDPKKHEWCPITGRIKTADPSSPTASSENSKAKAPPRDEEQMRSKFRNRLLQRYHTMVGAWRQIDPQAHGRVSFHDFCRACRHMGYDGEARPLWEALDANADGFVTFEELDPDLADVLQHFSQCCSKKCGSADNAWKEHFNKQGFGRCSKERFFKACQRLGVQEEELIGDVYNALDVDSASTGIAFEEFVMLDKWFKASQNGSWSYGQLRAAHLNS
jgi:hypothetical protein